MLVSAYLSTLKTRTDSTGMASLGRTGWSTYSATTPTLHARSLRTTNVLGQYSSSTHNLRLYTSYLSTLKTRTATTGMASRWPRWLVCVQRRHHTTACTKPTHNKRTRSVEHHNTKLGDDLVVPGGAEDASRRSHLMNCVQRCLRHRMLEAYIQQSHSVSIPMRDLALVSSYLPMLRTGLHSKQHTYSSHSSI
jgi:hypothetical protein